MKGASWPPGPIVRWYAVWLLCAAMDCIRVASTQARLEEVAAEFPHVDVIVLVGTQRKKFDAPKEHKETCGLITDRLRQWLGGLPQRTTPLVATDLNDGLGVVVQHNMKHDVDSDAVGNYCRSLEHSAAAAFREVLETHGMCAINTYYRTAPTYYGETQATLQLIKTTAPRDFCPLLLSFTPMRWHDGRGNVTEKRPRLDRQAIVAALGGGEAKCRFVQAVHQNLSATPSAQWEDLDRSPVPDQAWGTFVTAVRDATYEVFTKTVLEEAATKAAKRARHALLEQQKKFREAFQYEEEVAYTEVVKALAKLFLHNAQPLRLLMLPDRSG